EVDEQVEHRMEAIVDRLVIRKELYKQVHASITSGLVIGEGFLRFRISNPDVRKGGGGDEGRGGDEILEAASPLSPLISSSPFSGSEIRNPKSGGACPEHHIVMGEIHSYY